MKQQKIFQIIRIALFAAVMVGGCVLGFALGLRPTVSESENRTLAEFPETPDFVSVVTETQADGTEEHSLRWNTDEIDRFLSGDYTSAISLWYSDTFPYRDDLITLNGKLKGFFGLKTQTVSSGGSADNIETGGDFTWTPKPPAEIDPDPETDPTPAPNPDSDADTDVNTDPGADTEPETDPPVVDESEVISGYLVDGITGYQLYYFNEKNAHRYAQAVVQAALDLEGRAQVYSMITPMSYAYGISDETRDDLGVSDCKAAIDWYYYALEQYGISAGLTTPVVTVDVYSALEKHKDEYIFFRTDHHWTALGAYYASRTFLDLVDKDYPTLEDGYTHCEITGFTGTLANKTQGETSALINNPDTLYTYVPNSVNTVTITTKPDENGVTSILEKPIVNPDQNAYHRTQKYFCFMGGDYPYYEIHNETVTDGSAILIIKDSFGNAFTPMLVDSYEYIYVADHRWFRAMSLSDMVETYGIDTVLFINNPHSLAQDWNTGCIEKLVAVPSKIEVNKD